jgi:hypothetical protein
VAGGEGGRSEEGSAADDTKPRLGRSRHREARPADESRERPQRWWRGDDREREIERERERKKKGRESIGCAVLPLAAATGCGEGGDGRQAWRKRGASGAGSGSLESPPGRRC